MKKYLGSIIMFAIFETIAITLWLTKNNLFYLFNFSYIGISISLGLFLYIKKVKNARRVVQFLVGTYMLVYLGLISNENMQIEGFWYYLFIGVFEAATIHYAVAKIFGPIVFGRGWCGITFILSFVFVSSLFLLQVGNLESIMFWCFLIGNVLYYAVGITLAFILKDNRAFCKYICPITIFLKPMSYYSVLRVTCDKDKCVSCNKCKKVCPMDVDMTDNSRKRTNGTECILCMECIDNCSKGALKL